MKMFDSTTSEIEELDSILHDCLSTMDCFIGDPHRDYRDKERCVVHKKYECRDVIDWFCTNIRIRLEVIRQQGDYPELFEPVQGPFFLRH